MRGTAAIPGTTSSGAGTADVIHVGRGRNARIQLVGVGMMITLPVGCIVADVLFGAPTSRLDYTINGWFLLSWMAIGAYGGWRRARAVGLVADDNGLAEVGLFRARRWRWDEVAALGWDVDRQPVLAVCLRGQPIAVQVAASAAPIEQVRADLEMLRSLAESRGVDVDTGPDSAAQWWPADPRGSRAPSQPPRFGSN